jgi:hemerythrin-like domain-containing protein
MKALEFAHTAILVTTEEIEREVLQAKTPDVARNLKGRVDFLAQFIAAHVAGEEKALYPPLAAKLAHVDETFLMDHRDEEQIYEDLRGLTDRCAERGQEAELRELQRSIVVLRALSDSHIKKENQIVLGWIFEHFDVPAQAEMIGGILSVIPKEDMPKYVPWIVQCQAPDAAVAYVSIMQKNAPAPLFEAAKRWIQQGVSAERWSLLTGKIPELSV